MTENTNINNIVAEGMCTGCGMCAGICPQHAISFHWDDYGDYVPEVDESSCNNCGLCLRACPGKEVDFNSLSCFKQGVSGINCEDYKKSIIKLVRAKDKKSLANATSGGAVRTVAAYLVEQGIVDGAIMITDNHEDTPFPFYASGAVLHSPDEIRYHKVRSRYCPAPLCKIFSELDKNKKYVFVGLPCHVHAVRKLQILDQQWMECIPFVFGLLCSGTPTMKGNKYLFEMNGVDTTQIKRVDYRDGVFPGGVYGYMDDGGYYKVRDMGWVFGNLKMMLVGDAYMSSFFYRRRCRTCFDYFCQFSDLAFGDPWIPSYRGTAEGATLTFIRSEKGSVLFDKISAKGLWSNLSDVSWEEIKKMSCYPKKKMEGYKWIARYGKFFNFSVPEYKGAENLNYSFSSLRALSDLCCAELGKYELLWPVFKYIQFFRICLRVIERKCRKFFSENGV